MLEKIIEWKKEHFPNYKNLYFKQNELIDKMRSNHEKEKEKLNDKIDDQNISIETLNHELIDKNLKISELKSEKKKIDIEKNDLISKHNDEMKKLNHEIEELKISKRKLASSKGGLIKRVKVLENDINDMNQQNGNIKVLLQKVVKESGRKLTPPTIQELKNYKLFGNKEGIKKCQK